MAGHCPQASNQEFDEGPVFCHFFAALPEFATIAEICPFQMSVTLHLNDSKSHNSSETMKQTFDKSFEKCNMFNLY